MAHAARLITIPFSHYCGLARWSLDLAGIAYREEGHLPGMAMLYTKRARATPTTPVLVTGEGEVRKSSIEILRYADARGGLGLVPEAGQALDACERWLERFDRALGPATRRLAYGYLLDDVKHSKAYLRGFAPRGERWLTGFGYPILRGLIRRALAIDAASVERSRELIDEVFTEVEAALADGRRYLIGDHFTAADLSFAALSAPALFPEHPEDRMPKLDALPDALLTIIRPWRERTAGRFASRIWADHRECRAADR